MLHNIPTELRSLKQWVVADMSINPETGKPKKHPLNPRTGQLASVTDPSTWGTFEEAIRTGSHHVGFVLTDNDPYTIIDLDNKPDKPLTEAQWERHLKILNAFESYTERSVSGRGYHIIVRGRIAAGAHRDNVEVYCSGRYMICTGNVVRQAPIAEYQPLLDQLVGEMKPAERSELQQVDGPLDDMTIIDMAMKAANGDKFNALCQGDMSEYPSQSEADFALMSILAFYTQDNEQVRRLFRMSALGKREKAIKNNTYLDFALSKIRAQQPGPVDLNELKANAEAFIAASQTPATPLYNVGEDEGDGEMAASYTDEVPLPGYSLPPGLVGEIAHYIYSSAVRPVPEIALAAAIGLLAGVVGRSYNVSGTGLNQYIILLARTGRGKEGAASGIESLIAAVRPQVPMASDFMGPASFASGQALIRTVSKRPCFVSVLGEFGLTLQQLSDARASSAEKMLKRVLLDLYAKSGWHRFLQPSVYSDSDKDTQAVQAPCVTILGESTPETFFDGLDQSHIAEGLIPRFSIIEYDGNRPARNQNAGHPPSQQLVSRFAEVIATAVTTSNNNSCAPIQIDSPAMRLLNEFDAHADKIMNTSKMEVETELWNRAHLKSLKLSALLAVGVNPHSPVVTSELATWAIDFVKRDISVVVKRFARGDVGTGDSKQYNDLRRVIEAYLKGGIEAAKKYGIPENVAAAGLVPYKFLVQRTANVSSFKRDRLGATAALKRTIQNMVEAGNLVEVTKGELVTKYKFHGLAYGLSATGF